MYVGGDYLAAVVADLGSHSTRIGFAGEDYPRVSMPTAISVAATEGGDEPVPKNYNFDMSQYTPGTSIHMPVTDGIITDWDWLERVWEHSMTNALRADNKDTPVMMSEKVYNTSSSRRKLCELMFESQNAPAFFLSKDVVLATFATGRTSGVVVDAGGSGTAVVPVQDGWADLKGFNRSIIGGRYLDAYMLRLLKKQSIQARPAYRISKTLTPDYSISVSDLNLGNVCPTYEAWSCLEIGRDLKESVCRTSDVAVVDGDPKYVNMPLLPYELPDGTHVDIGHERFQPSELFFDPAGLELQDPLLGSLGLNILDPSRVGESNVFASVDSLPRLVVDSILRSENTDAQAAMCGNIVVTGGTSCLDGLSERLKAEVEAIVFMSAPSWKVRTITASAPERPVCAWLGGSILASLGTFHETWIARSEYDEYGPNLVDKKCP